MLATTGFFPQQGGGGGGGGRGTFPEAVYLSLKYFNPEQ